MPLARRCVRYSCEMVKVCRGRAIRPLIRQFYLTRHDAAGECGAPPTLERLSWRAAPRVMPGLAQQFGRSSMRRPAVTGGKSFCSAPGSDLACRSARVCTGAGNARCLAGRRRAQPLAAASAPADHSRTVPLAPWRRIRPALRSRKPHVPSRLARTFSVRATWCP